MDSELNQYRQIIKRVLLKHAERVPSHGELEIHPVFDEERDIYLLVSHGWDATGRTHDVIFHLMLKDGKIWIEVDGSEEGIADELNQTGITKDKIVLGFYRPKRREITEFAIA